MTTSDDAILYDPAGEVARLIGDGRAREAADACARIINAGRGGALVRAAHGRALTASGHHDEAITALREATQLSPHAAELLLAFGEALAWPQVVGMGLVAVGVALVELGHGR